MTIRDLLYGALFAALTAVLGYIVFPLPFSPVPVTGQSLAVMLAGSVLTMGQAALSLITFLFLGIIGIPVFAGGTAGLGIIFGPRGGYLIGFLVGAIVIALIKEKLPNHPLSLAFANLIGGIGVVYFLGAFWLNYVTAIGMEKAIITGVLPFIPGDLFKLVVASLVGFSINKRMGRR